MDLRSGRNTSDTRQDTRRNAREEEQWARQEESRQARTKRMEDRNRHRDYTLRESITQNLPSYLDVLGTAGADTYMVPDQSTISQLPIVSTTASQLYSQDTNLNSHNNQDWLLQDIPISSQLGQTNLFADEEASGVNREIAASSDSRPVVPACVSEVSALRTLRNNCRERDKDLFDGRRNLSLEDVETAIHFRDAR
jgi:hypothetical protein